MRALPLPGPAPAQPTRHNSLPQPSELPPFGRGSRVEATYGLEIVRVIPSYCMLGCIFASFVKSGCMFMVSKCKPECGVSASGPSVGAAGHSLRRRQCAADRGPTVCWQGPSLAHHNRCGRSATCAQHAVKHLTCRSVGGRRGTGGTGRGRPKEYPIPVRPADFTCAGRLARRKRLPTTRSGRYMGSGHFRRT